MSDHHPTCPRCGDICEPRQERCDCGTLLYYVAPKPRRVAWAPTYVACACGCGATFTSVDRWKRPRRYLPGHNNILGVQTGAKPKLSVAAGWWSERFTAAELRDLGAGL